MKTILFISPTPTHPTTAGNRVHILNICDFLRNQGHQVHFLYLAYENFSEEEMKAYWKDKFHFISRETLYAPTTILNRFQSKLGNNITKTIRYFQSKLGFISSKQFYYNQEIDAQYSKAIYNKVAELKSTINPNIVICEYVAFSKALTFFDDSVLKIIDTHDKFTDRFEVYLRNNLKPQWWSFYKTQERKGLQRANALIALNEDEANFFEQLSGVPTSVYYPIPKMESKQESENQNAILYFGSSNSINIKSLEQFEQNVFPKLLDKIPDLILYVGGSICDKFSSANSNIILKGKFDHPSDFYKLGAVVINPEIDGTGFKIKTLEAICNHKVVVCTTAGAKGLNAEKAPLIIANNDDEFVTKTIELLKDFNYRKSLEMLAEPWLELRKNEVEASLKNLIENSKKE